MALSGSAQTTARLAAVRAALVGQANPEHARAMAAYMKEQFHFFGVPSPQRRVAQKPTLDELAGASGNELIDFARACWSQDEREFQYVAGDALRKHQNALAACHLPSLAELITLRCWWDTVDTLAVHTVGPLVARHPELRADMDAWIDSDNIWLARTAILHQLSYKQRTDAERLFGYADRRAADTEFFIRKALGWALRQYARTDPGAVRAYVASRSDRLSGLTKREAMKRL